MLCQYHVLASLEHDVNPLFRLKHCYEHSDKYSIAHKCSSTDTLSWASSYSKVTN